MGVDQVPERGDEPTEETRSSADGGREVPGFLRVEALVERTVQLGELRRFVTGAVALLGLGTFDDVAVLTHELVKNALALDERHIRVSVQRRMPDAVRVEVTDYGYGLPVLDHSGGLDGGFGLRLVDRLADRWGVDQFLPGKIVWFELEPRATQPRAAVEPR
jgi:anti-sigma regulatory factor (Ser/Thr protein kinase)